MRSFACLVVLRSTLLCLVVALSLANVLFLGSPTQAATASPAATTVTAVASGPWSRSSTWGGTLPSAGANVIIPSGVTVSLDTSTASLGILQVDGGLSFAPVNLTLTARAIMVHGWLRAGTAGSPYVQRGRIVLTGSDTGEDIMGMGSKVLGVMGGAVDLHGRAGVTSWTRLGANARAGDSSLTVVSALGWQPGARIVVASTDFEANQAEEFTITAVTLTPAGASVLALDRPLAYSHWGSGQTFGTRRVDERAEVGLLSHNLSVEGAVADSAGGYGGQIMVMNGGAFRMAGVSLTRMGQKAKLRRYPIHFHMLGSTPTARGVSYVKDSAIVNTFNRCITIHGTNKLTVSGNVCYRHIGHGFFFEDGAETGTNLLNNLGLLTLKPEAGQAILPSDSETPATFWITNPHNVMKGNVAAGSAGMGFWMALPEHPTGLSTNTTTWNRRTALTAFSDNRAHSNTHGFFVDSGPRPDGTTETTYYDPRSNPADPQSAPVNAVFSQLVAYKNRYHGIWLRGTHHIVDNSVLADNGMGATFASEYSRLSNSLVVGETANLGTPETWTAPGLGGRSLPQPWEAAFPIRGFQFYDGLVAARGVSFFNFVPNSQRNASGLGFLLDNQFSLHPGNQSAGLTFVNANRVWLPPLQPGFDGDSSALFTDTDGTVTGTAGARVMANNPFLMAGACTYRSSWNAQVCPPGAATYLRIATESISGTTQQLHPVRFTRPDGAAQTLDGYDPSATSVTTTAVGHTSYRVSFAGGIAPTQTAYRVINGVGQWVQFAIPYASAPSRITRWGCDIADASSWCYGGAPTSLAQLQQSQVDSAFYDAAAGLLYVRLKPSDEYDQLEVVR